MTSKDVPNVGKMDSSLKNSEVVASPPEGAEDTGSKLPKRCFFNGEEYTGGAMVCSGGVLLKCNNYYGTWTRAGSC